VRFVFRSVSFRFVLCVTIGDFTRRIHFSNYNTHPRNTHSNNRVITPRVPQIWRAAALK